MLNNADKLQNLYMGYNRFVVLLATRGFFGYYFGIGLNGDSCHCGTEATSARIVGSNHECNARTVTPAQANQQYNKF